MDKVNINLITVGDRYRKDLGDIDALANSINVLGLLQPIGIDSNYALIFGERRLRACQQLGLDTIGARIIHVDNLAAEHDENEIRKAFTVSERVAIGRAREESLGNRVGRPSKNEDEIVPNSAQLKGAKTRDLAAAEAGFKRTSYSDASKVVDSGADELIEAMDSGNVSISAAAAVATLPKEEQADVVAKGEKEILKAAKEIRAKKATARRSERVEKIAAMADSAPALVTAKKYPVIYCDPPWRYDYAESDSRAIENQYPTMELVDICQMPVGDIAHDDAVLFMWGTSPKLLEAIEVIKAWGFTYKTCAVWDKQKIGMGYYFRQQHELLLIATRGNLPPPEPHNRPASVFSFEREDHSSKPHEVAEMIERMYPEYSRIELFCRSPRDGWDVWGNQSGEA